MIMTTQQILHELEHLSPTDLLRVIEVATQRMMKEFQLTPIAPPLPTRQTQLAQAAEALWADYVNDEELRAFTALDAEELIHVAG
jgi:hypothetical protein